MTELTLGQKKLLQEIEIWHKTIDKIISEQKLPKNSILLLKQTPLSMHLLGADVQKNLYISPKALVGLLDNDSVGVEELKQVPKELTDPIAVFKSAGSYLYLLDIHIKTLKSLYKRWLYNMSFANWLQENTSLSLTSIYKYSRAINTISKEMIQLGVIKKPLLDMDKLELEIAIGLISFNHDFLAKDKRGNKMYSNSLKQFKYYYLSSFESSNTIEQELINEINNDNSLSRTTKESIILSRIGQGTFRNKIIDKYTKCIITGVDNPKLLVASHIKPWSISNNQERLSVNNGFLLTPTYDKLFDIGLITFDATSKLKVSHFLGKENEKRLNIKKNEKYDLQLNPETLKNMQYHNDFIFVR